MLGLDMDCSICNSGLRYVSLVWGRLFLVKDFRDLEVGSSTHHRLGFVSVIEVLLYAWLHQRNDYCG